jgi:membrane-bound lytic murein transglycosylase MltF
MQVGWAFRKNSPELGEALNSFVKRHKVGSRLTNILINRYLKSTRYVKNTLAGAERKKYRNTVALFKKFGDQFGFDWLLLVAQGYQESGLRQDAKSAVGAVGIMQVLPSTAKNSPVSINNFHEVEGNIHAGVKYLRYMVDSYFNDPAISKVDQHLFAFAGYNAGPNRIARLREKAAQQGLDANKSFNNVEIIVTKHVGTEPVHYVRNIFKYYIAYRRIEDERTERQSVREGLRK